MKQRITPDQLKELTGKQRVKLDVMVSKRWSPMFNFVTLDGNVLPTLTIGHMIELLKGRLGVEWDYIYNSTINMRHELYHKDKQLCDYLWEALKEVL